MNNQLIEFGEWTPDMPSIGAACTVATNVIPQAKSYRSVNTLKPFTTALNGSCLGAFWAMDSTGTVNNFAGDSTALYRLDGSTWDDVSHASGYSADRWEFINWGGRVIGVAAGNSPQYYDMGAGAAFADLPGAPPQAAHIAIVRDFIVLGAVYDGTSRPSRIVWSGYNNSEQWAPSQSTQSDFQDLLGNGGKIQRIVPGEYGVILQESSIWRMDYVGPPVIFQLSEVETQRGTSAPGSVGWFGRMVFYWGNSGFYLFNGQHSSPIGAEKIDRFVADDLDSSRLEQFQCAVDRKQKLVFWSYPSVTKGNALVCYNFVANRWSLIEQSTQQIFEYASSGYSLDSLDTLFSDIDSESISVDSAAYQGGELSLAAFNASGALGLFNGAPLTATVETGDFLSPDDRMLFVEKGRVLAEGAGVSATLRHATRDEQSGSYSYGPAIAPNAYGEHGILKKGRFHRFRALISGGASHIRGVNVRLRPAGNR